MSKLYINKKVILISGVISIATASAYADQVIRDDHIVVGSQCVGLDCVNGENFGFDTIRLKENNVRIKFQDTSSSSSFPTTDWQITANDSSNGGANKFSIENIDRQTVPFTIIDGAENNSLFIGNGGRVGFGTSAPTTQLHTVTGNSPTLRLDQDGSSGFSPQVWDVGGNESNFFIRDTSNSSRLIFRIVPGAPDSSIFVASDGDVGFGTSTPDGQFDVRHASNANDHALLISSISNVGVNIDNGFLPMGLFDVQTTGGDSRFTVASSGRIGIGTSSPSSLLNLLTDDVNGDHSVVLQNTNPAGTNARLLRLSNEGSAFIVMADSSSSAVVSEWFIGSRDDGRFSITNSENPGAEFELLDTGDLMVSGTVNGTSSIATKENLMSIDPSAILSKVGDLFISQWNYKKDDASVKHIGPVSEDFHKLFGLNGDKDDRISYTDLSGIALASIQALKKESDLLKQRESEKDKEISLLQERINKLEQAVEKLTAK